MEPNNERIDPLVTLLIKNIRVFNTSQCCFEKKDVALSGHVFYLIEDRLEIECNEVIDGSGFWMIPGLIDIHMHVESSMTYPQAFYEEALKWGTTTCVADPHEIANVKGVEGIRFFLDNAKDTDLFFGIPSSVPSTNQEIETTGGIIGLTEVEELLKNPRMKCLGEVMNFVDMKKSNSKTNSLIRLCQKERPDFLIEGHCPKLSGEDLSYYLYCGVDADHTQQTPESILEKTSKGMFLEIQEKSVTKENIDTLVSHELYDMFCFVTDDKMAHHLVKGHLNEVVKKAIRYEMPLEKAIYCSTFTPARRMHFADRGIIAPGKIADFIILSDLEHLAINSVYKMGEKVQQKKVPKPYFPIDYYHSINLRPLSTDDFQLPKVNASKVRVQVIEIEPLSTFTKKKTMLLDVEDGIIQWQKADLSLIAVFERYGKNGNKAFGFVKNELEKKTALASTWVHDHHNLMVMGNDINEMVKIANEVIMSNGGYGISLDGKIALTVLDIAGIISSQPLEEVAKSLEKVASMMVDAGYYHINPIMSFSTLSLPVSPEIKITDVGLIDVREQKVLPLIVEEIDA